MAFAIYLRNHSAVAEEVWAEFKSLVVSTVGIPKKMMCSIAIK